MVPLFLKWHHFQPFFEKRLLTGSIFENGSSLPGGTVFFLNMIMKKKIAPLCQRGAVFQNGSSEAPFWLHFISEWRQLKTLYNDTILELGPGTPIIRGEYSQNNNNNQKKGWQALHDIYCTNQFAQFNL